MQPIQKKYDVLIVGRGITGLSCAWHLHKLAPKLKIALIGKSEPSTTSLTPGIAYRSPQDNITRLADSSGIETTQQQWRFHTKAFDAFKCLLNESKLPHHLARSFRIGAHAHEDQEILKAQKLLSDLKEPSRAYALRPHVRDLPILSKKDAYMVQEELKGVLFFSPAQLMTKLEKTMGHLFLTAQVDQVEENQDRVRAQLNDHTSLSGEMLVLAAHSQTTRLEPWLQDSLIPYCDQYMSFESTPRQDPYQLSLQHGLHWKAQLGRRVFIGGGRYLRKNAGIDEVQGRYEEKIEKHLLAGLHRAKLVGPVFRTSYLGIRPCDEKPIIGPIPGKSRTLVASGFMHRGWTLGWLSGSSLAELIIKGESKTLPRCYWPERFRF